MAYGSFWEGMLIFFSPLAPTLKGMDPFNPLISIVILGLLAYVLIRGQRRYELLRMETETLIRRYMIYRGKRHRTLSKARLPKGTREQILKSISRSWHSFKAYHTQQRQLLERNYRGLRMGFIVGCVLLVLNTVREGIAGLVIAELPSGLFIGLLHTLPLLYWSRALPPLLPLGGGGVRPHGHTERGVIQWTISSLRSRPGGPVCRLRSGRSPSFRGV